MTFKELGLKALKLESLIACLEHSNERRELGALAEDLRVDLEYEYAREHAQSQGWTCPDSTTIFDKSVWIRYWTDVDASEKNPDAGRAIIPHRSGG